MNYEPFTSIENPTLSAAADLAHFRHFRHFSSLFTKFSSTSVENPLQINLFMQNKPNFRKSQMNVKSYNTTDYENKSNWTLGESKPNSNPITRMSKMNVNSFITKDYRKKDDFAVQKNKPNSNPVLSLCPRCAACPERSRMGRMGQFLQKAEMNINFYVAGYYESKPTFAANNPNVDITTAFSCGASPSPSLMGWARIVTPEG